MRATGKVLGMRILNESIHPRKLRNYSFNCFPMKQFNDDNDRKGSRIEDLKKVKCATARKTAMKWVDRSGDLPFMEWDKHVIFVTLHTLCLTSLPTFSSSKLINHNRFLNILK